MDTVSVNKNNNQLFQQALENGTKMFQKIIKFLDSKKEQNILNESQKNFEI